MLKKKQSTSAELGMRTSSDLQQPHCMSRIARCEDSRTEAEKIFDDLNNCGSIKRGAP